MAIFIIEDEMHSEIIGKYTTFVEAMNELKRLASLPWDKEPNRAPCVGWKTCQRNYVIIEYDDSTIPWKELRYIPALEIDSTTVYWYKEINLD